MQKRLLRKCFRPLANQQGGVTTSIMMVLLVVAGVYYLAGHHLVMTEDGLRSYPKKYLGSKDTYVDMRRLGVADIGDHREVVAAMATHGDLHHVPGGELFGRMAQTGESIAQAVKRIDRDYHISGSAREIGRITAEKYHQVDERYDLHGKAEKAGEKLKEGADTFHEWLQEQ